MTAREAARVSLFDTLASSLIATIPPITDRSTQSSSDSRRTTHDVRPLCVSRAREISASSTVPRFHDSPVPRFHGSPVPRFPGSTVPRSFNSNTIAEPDELVSFSPTLSSFRLLHRNSARPIDDAARTYRRLGLSSFELALLLIGNSSTMITRGLSFAHGTASVRSRVTIFYNDKTSSSSSS